MQAPYQCIEKCGRILIAASGPSLHAFSLSDGSRQASWTSPLVSNLKLKQEETSDERNVRINSQIPDLVSPSGPPAKRRKFSGGENNPLNERIKASHQLGDGGSQGPQSAAAPAVVYLRSTQNGKHVIAVTGEDKTIRVFEWNGKDNLKQLSERPMPKRPCSLAITASDSTIIYADKFGDVYSLPLLSPELPNNVLDQPENHEEAQAISEEPKQFFTAANDLTVHSARNRRALENQLRQNQKRAQKTELNPGQKLLLGHVSMLTDIALMERDGRSYIITADRDEHIRISRGMPQEHIIESYCLGHTEFVSRLCFPSPYPNLLISGGGDDNLLVWDWISGKLLTKTDLRSALENFQATANSQKNITPSRVVKFAVSTMRYVPLGPNMVNGSIVVSCEGMPALFFFSLSQYGALVHIQTLALDGNALDIATDSLSGNLIVSIDTIHTPGSTTELRNNENAVQALQTFQFKESAWGTSNLTFDTPDADATQKEAYGTLSGVLYNLENLRKRGGEE